MKLEAFLFLARTSMFPSILTACSKAPLTHFIEQTLLPAMQNHLSEPIKEFPDQGNGLPDEENGLPEPIN
jgi:hypothetical protein